MKITALDIRQKTFEQKTFRGIDKDEVQAFLNLISQQWERLGDENRELRLKLEHAQQDVQKMREVESSLYRTLKTAEDTGQSITEQAQREADLRGREAQFQAEQLLSEARQAARKITDDAYQQAEKTVADMQREVSTLAQESQRLESQFDGLVRDLHHLASEALEKAEKAQSRTKASAAAILSRAASVKVERPKEPASELSTPMHLSLTSAVSSAPAVAGGAAPAAAAAPAGSGYAPVRAEAQATQLPSGAYNPKPGQQPDPHEPDRTTAPDPYEPYVPSTVPHPDIERPQAPAENPGISPAPRIDQPAPSQVPSPEAPRVEPVAPDFQPLPSHPEIQQPAPMTHPGMAAAPAAGGSFFDEI